MQHPLCWPSSMWPLPSISSLHQPTPNKAAETDVNYERRERNVLQAGGEAIIAPSQCKIDSYIRLQRLLFTTPLAPRHNDTEYCYSYPTQPLPTYLPVKEHHPLTPNSNHPFITIISIYRHSLKIMLRLIVFFDVILVVVVSYCWQKPIQ